MPNTLPGVPPTTTPRWQTDGKFFRVDGARLHPRIVTYGPFPGGWPLHHARDFQRIADAGFHAIRTYELPPRAMLDSAAQAGLKIFAGLQWEQYADFLSGGPRLSAARIRLADWLGGHGDHPALAAVYVGNEIPADLVRWMGPERVLNALEELISLGKETAPDVLFAYANFPSTEYLEPGNADFTAFNIYLEHEAQLDRYLKRLHHIAGDRPLVVSEFGLDSQRNGLQRQADLLGNATAICEANSIAALTIFSWSDRWLSAGIEVLDWDFGITDRQGHAKPALASLANKSASPRTHAATAHPAISAIICTRNGRQRIGKCLASLLHSVCHSGLEIIVVDDGSTDDTAAYVRNHFPTIRLLTTAPAGLSAARNAGARIAKSDILAFTDDDCEPDHEWLQRAIDFLSQHPDHAAVGGPNLPQRPRNWREAVVCSAPGAPSHVMLDDTTAEHLPGCNLIVRKSAWAAIDGFDERFHTAGDDVDFCWRLQDAGFRLGFHPAAFVWHWRRSSLCAYLRQQIGYGKAERLLIAKHPDRFSKNSSAVWQGVIYNGAPVRITRDAILYQGTTDHRTYHPTLQQAQPLRSLDSRHAHCLSRTTLRLVRWLAPALRTWHRSHRFPSLPASMNLGKPIRSTDFSESFIAHIHREELIQTLLQKGWHPYRGEETWDLENDGRLILLATELGDLGSKRTLIRSCGQAPFPDHHP